MYKVIRKRLHICIIFVNIEFLKILKTYALLVKFKNFSSRTMGPEWTRMNKDRADKQYTCYISRTQ